MMYTPGQILLQRALVSPLQVVIVNGPAGSGKTMLASTMGIKALNERKYAKMIITRPAVSAGEEHGFLPGEIENKMDPWVRPISEYTGKKFEVCPLGYMRGRTFDDSWIIADEMQNSSPTQMKMMLTRIGKRSKLVITGDTTQCDIREGDSGLTDIIKRVKHRMSDNIKYIELTEDDVMRSDVVKEILGLYL